MVVITSAGHGSPDGNLVLFDTNAADPAQACRIIRSARENGGQVSNKLLRAIPALADADLTRLLQAPFEQP